MKWVLLLAGLSTTSFVSTATAWDDDEDKTLSYDEIVSELKMESQSIPKPKVVEEMDAKVYFGIAYGLSRVESSVASTTMQGTQFTLGLDFSPTVATEAIYRNFPGQEITRRQSVDLQELEARLLYKPKMNEGWRARLGAGLVSRSLNFTSSGSSSTLIRWSLGFERRLNQWLRIYPEISLRSNLVSNDVDKNGVDAGVGFQVIF